MQNDISDMRGTIEIRSDQLNSEDLIGRSITILITDVRIIDSKEQPVTIAFEGDNGKPFKPSKTVRKLLVHLWGHDGREWIGRALRLFCDEDVRFGDKKVGGIRVSHMSHIDKAKEVSLLTTKGKKGTFRVDPLEIPELSFVLAAIDKATNKAGMEAARALAEQLVARADIDAAREAYGAKLKALKGAKPAAEKPGVTILDALVARIENAADRDAAWAIVEEARKSVEDAEAQQLETAFTRAWE